MSSIKTLSDLKPFHRGDVGAIDVQVFCNVAGKTIHATLFKPTICDIQPQTSPSSFYCLDNKLFASLTSLSTRKQSCCFDHLTLNPEAV